MVVFKRKTHTISLRVSEEEYEILHQASRNGGARSVSDYAREALFRSICVSPRPTANRLEDRMNKLASELETLNREVHALRAAVGNPQ